MVLQGVINVGKGKLFHGRLYDSPSEASLAFRLFKKSNVTVIWNLLESGEYNELEEKEFEVIRSPIKNQGIPDSNFPEDAKKILEVLNRGDNVYVHCLAGQGRTGMAVAAILILEGLDVDSALSKVFNDGLMPNREQMEYIRCMISH